MSDKDIQKVALVAKSRAIRFPELQRFWEESKQKEVTTIERLKVLIREHVRKDSS